MDFEAVKRILEAGNKAPTWNHNRNWHYIVLHTDEEKEYAFDYAKKIADKFDAEKYLTIPRPYPVTLAQKMYAHAMPRQFTMLKTAPYVIIPVFKCKELNGEYVSKLNPFSTIWCVVENIFLAATAEGLACSMRIPLNEEHIAGAENIDVKADDFAEQIKGIEGTVAVYCVKGVRSLKAAKQLAAQGCTVYDLDGGLNAWKQAGEPTE